MNERDLGPLPPDVADAVAGERTRPGVDAVTRARIRTRLHATLLAGPAGGTPPAPDAPPASAAPGTMSGLRALRSLHPGLTAAVGFVVGVTTGIAAHAWLAPAVVHRSATDVTPLTPITEPPSATVAPAPVPRAVPPSDLAAPREATASPGVPSGAALAAPSLPAERALLDIAHTALAKGEATEALDALGQHAKKFPHGVYREEREALTIKALRSLGRTDEAARRAAAFTARYPNSLFRSIVEAAPGSNP